MTEQIDEDDESWLDEPADSEFSREDSVICGDCNGSGEGMHDGSICWTCGGEGEI